MLWFIDEQLLESYGKTVVWIRLASPFCVQRRGCSARGFVLCKGLGVSIFLTNSEILIFWPVAILPKRTFCLSTRLISGNYSKKSDIWRHLWWNEQEMRHVMYLFWSVGHPLVILLPCYSWKHHNRNIWQLLTLQSAVRNLRNTQMPIEPIPCILWVH